MGSSVTSTLLTGIAELTTHADSGGLADSTVADAAMVVVDGRVAWTGPGAGAPDADERVELGGRAVIPGFVDSHAHLVFAGDRAQEFAARMTGAPYSAGGIRTTVAATRGASDDVLRSNLRRLVGEMLRQGTTTVECKSGYGLTVEDEARALRLAREQVEAVTYLGAHVVPAEYKDRAGEYVDLVKGPMLDACAPYADFADVFCERGAFDEEQTREILTAARAKGLDLRLHANQLGNGPGVQLAVEFGAASADHCTFLDDKDIDALAGSQTIATLLPGVEFSTRSPYPDARRLLDAGATVAIATDCNPGSCYTNSMPFCIAVAVRDMHMSPAEALWAATVGGAKALRRDDVGHLGVGARADFAVLDAPSYLHLAYRPGVPLVHRVWKNGTPVAG
ncbi:imidazolonepropionase [Catenulispora acidiphila DSM 44928]|uniref:Imidazolonepropionase n=1 Tax=Catenulispora acidiphila (strain DSM 44928 / JCM 14897 / NBRC 102108 / NRRL B-24433 / ID139908) TaxID=479433 RepID=C7QJ61_CATAD|nr:imidazolonepropionase [Catenulispora acidiphila DSM 44928]